MPKKQSYEENIQHPELTASASELNAIGKEDTFNNSGENPISSTKLTDIKITDDSGQIELLYSYSKKKEIKS